jgi:NADH dehydrogenase
MSEVLQETPRSLEVTLPRASRSSPSAGAQSRPRKQVVIVGGGFAGIATGRALRRCDVEVLLIDRRNHHIFQPLLHQVATAVLEPSEIAAPLRQLAKIQKNVNVMLGDVIDVNLESRSIDVSCPGVGIRQMLMRGAGA